MDDTPDPDPAPGKARKARPNLSRERIVAETFSLVDEGGLDAFSFRTLAARLNCQAMSLYHYFPGKAQLFEAMADACVAELPPPATGSWRERLAAEARLFRTIPLRHPGFFPYFVIFRQNNATGMAYLDRILSVFAATGLPPARQAFHFRILGYFLGGAGMEEALGYAKGPSSANPVPPDVARRDYPAIMAVGPWFAADHHEAIFSQGLETLLDAIEADIARHGPGGRAISPGSAAPGVGLGLRR